jgi:hypothetical protein
MFKFEMGSAEILLSGLVELSSASLLVSCRSSIQAARIGAKPVCRSTCADASE